MKPSRIAAAAFCFHHPGVHLLYGLEQRPALRRLNAWLLGITIASTAMATAVTSAPLVWAGVTFAVGHFAWSTLYALLILRGPERIFENYALAGEPRSRAPPDRSSRNGCARSELSRGTRRRASPEAREW